MERRSVVYEMTMRKFASDLYMRSIKRGHTKEERTFRKVLLGDMLELDRIIDEAIEQEATARAEETGVTLGKVE